MQLNEGAISKALKCPRPEERIRETATLFRLLSEDIIKALRSDTLRARAFILFESMTYSVRGDIFGKEDGIFADVAKGEAENEYFAQLYYRQGGKRSKELSGGFSLFYEQDYKKLNAQLKNPKEAK